MDLSKIKSIVHKFFDNLDSYLEHIDNSQLVLNDKKYRIQPDDAYIFNDEIIIIEYEKNKRLVESISKYWWLLKNTNWIKNHFKIKYIILILRPDLNEIREESLIILGEELSKQYPDFFEFNYLKYSEINEQEIINLLKQKTS